MNIHFKKGKSTTCHSDIDCFIWETFILKILFIALYIPLTNTLALSFQNSKCKTIRPLWLLCCSHCLKNTKILCVCYSFQHIHHSSQEVQKALVLNVRLQNTNAIITEIIERFLAHLDPLQLWNLLFSCLMIPSQIGEYFSPMPWWKPQVITIKLCFSLCWVSALTVVVLLLLSLSFSPS